MIGCGGAGADKIVPELLWSLVSAELALTALLLPFGPTCLTTLLLPPVPTCLTAIRRPPNQINSFTGAVGEKPCAFIKPVNPKNNVQKGI